jgi:hypothetical protein
MLLNCDIQYQTEFAWSVKVFGNIHIFESAMESPLLPIFYTLLSNKMARMAACSVKLSERKYRFLVGGDK